MPAQIDILDNELVNDIEAIHSCILQYLTTMYLQNKTMQYLYFQGYTG